MFPKIFQVNLYFHSPNPQPFVIQHTPLIFTIDILFKNLNLHKVFGLFTIPLFPNKSPLNPPF